MNQQLITISTTKENLARLGELLIYLYQDDNWQASDNQTIDILFQQDDVTIFQMCDNEEALSHEVMTS